MARREAILPRARAPRRLGACFALATAVIIAASCDEPMTSARPNDAPPTDSLRPPAFAVTGAVEGDISGTYPLPMASADWVEGSRDIGTTSSGGQLYKITVRGLLERIGLYNGAPYPSVPYTAYGAFACSGGVNVWYNTNGNIWNGACTGTNGSTTEVRYAKLYNQVWATRTKGDQSGGCGWDSVDRFNLCYTFRDAEPYQVTLERVKARLVVTPGFAALKAGESVTFALSVAATEDQAAPTSSIPFTVQGWTFTPDGGTAAPRSCYLTCAMSPTQSGWLTVTGVANGEPQEVNVRIKVFTDFTVVADSSVAMVGSTVKFTAFLDGEKAPASAWQWQIDTTSSDSTGLLASRASGPFMHSLQAGAFISFPSPCFEGADCLQPLQAPGDGRMLATLRTVGGMVIEAPPVDVRIIEDRLDLTASPSTVRAGEKVKFEARTEKGKRLTITGWSWRSADSSRTLTGVTRCGTEKTCEIPVYESGTMTVLGWIEGSGDQIATTTVAVTPCPPTDQPLLNDVGFVKNLIEAAAVSRSNGLERGGDVYSRPSDGSQYARDIPNSLQSPCAYSADMANAPPLPTGFTVRQLIEWHTHGHRPGSIYTGCKGNPKVRPTDVVQAQDGISMDGDWPSAVISRQTGVMIDYFYNIWIWNDTPPHDGSDFAIKKYKRSGQSACYERVQ